MYLTILARHDNYLIMRIIQAAVAQSSRARGLCVIKVGGGGGGGFYDVNYIQSIQKRLSFANLIL